MTADRRQAAVLASHERLEPLRIGFGDHPRHLLVALEDENGGLLRDPMRLEELPCRLSKLTRIGTTADMAGIAEQPLQDRRLLAAGRAPVGVHCDEDGLASRLVGGEGVGGVGLPGEGSMADPDAQRRDGERRTDERPSQHDWSPLAHRLAIIHDRARVPLRITSCHRGVSAARKARELVRDGVVELRLERPDDPPAIAMLVRTTFGRDGEALLLAQLRAADAGACTRAAQCKPRFYGRLGFVKAAPLGWRSVHEVFVRGDSGSGRGRTRPACRRPGSCAITPKATHSNRPVWRAPALAAAIVVL